MYRRAVIFFFALAALFFHAALGATGGENGAEAAAGPDAPVSTRMVRLPERISPADLNRMMIDLPGTFELVDIRPPAQFEDYRIPGSKNVAIAELIDNRGYRAGTVPLIILDRDDSLAMAVGGILCQKTDRPIKVLYGGLKAYWEETMSRAWIGPPPPLLPRGAVSAGE